MSLYALPPLVKAQVVNRPSKTIKSPYVADIMLTDDSTTMCHSPGLSCCGLVSTGRTIYVSKAKNAASKTAYSAQIAACTDSEGTYFVGISPMISQHVASKLLDHVALNVTWATEVKISEHTRLDFVGTYPDGKKIYVEVKNAMISLSDEKRQRRRAIFPEGYRKSKTDTISPRAVKHAETLAELAKTEEAALVFIVPRNDCGGGLELNPNDPIYCNAVKQAIKAGVKIFVFGLNFLENGSIEFTKRLNFFIQ